MTKRISVVVLAVLALAAPASAQETQTEREAAKGVLQKMASLETSLDVPAMVARLAATNARRDGVAARAKQLMETELLALYRRRTTDLGTSDDTSSA